MNTIQLQPAKPQLIIPKTDYTHQNFPVYDVPFEIIGDTISKVPFKDINEDIQDLGKNFIESNTKRVTLSHLTMDCVVPVFSKDNEITLSHQDFIGTVYDAAQSVYRQETISKPDVRVSHIIKGRTPEATHKPVDQLLDSDKTIYYERMAFCFDIPTIYDEVNGNKLNLTIGGVRAYNHENLYNRKTYEKFKVFIGFKNLVCCNLCIMTDGYKSEIRAMGSNGLFLEAEKLFRRFPISRQIDSMKRLTNTFMDEHQFAQFLGKGRLYQVLPQKQKKHLPELLMTDTQMNLVAKAYYQDKDFGVDQEQSTKQISMWNVYNLLTQANKMSYIDQFLDRASNATSISEGISKALRGDKEYGWFIQ